MKWIIYVCLFSLFVPYYLKSFAIVHLMLRDIHLYCMDIVCSPALVMDNSWDVLGSGHGFTYNASFDIGETETYDLNTQELNSQTGEVREL